MDKDLIVIGGGPGGYVAAIRAAQLGANVCIIERDRLGGTCLNRGCIPTKALYRNAEIMNILNHINDFGISIDNFSIDVQAVQNRKHAVVDQLVDGIDQLLKANKIEIVKGSASFKDKNTVKVALSDGSEKELTSGKIIIATGSKPVIPPIPGAGIEGIYTSEDILNFDSIPKTLSVIGGGVIGMELACIFNALGTKVTVIEFLPGILSQIDSDITKRLSVSLKKKGIEIYTGTKVTAIEKNAELFTILCEGKKGPINVEADKVLLSTGRTPVTEGLDLEGTGIIYDRRGIKVDEHFETNVKGIYAIGDVNGINMLAHAASHQGVCAAEHIMGMAPHMPSTVPGCVFIFPEVAAAGITEDDAKLQGISYKTSKFMFGANGKALALGEGEGFVKVIASQEDVIIGVHIMGPHASDLIHEAALAVNNKMKVDDVKNTIHAHPTLSEAFYEAVLGLHGEAIHMVPAKR